MSTTSAPLSQVSEETHRAAEAAIRHFSYKKPTEFERKKVSVMLGQGDLVRGMIQVAKEGGENNLHYHANVDGFWMVLKGKAKFYGPGDALIGEIGPLEGLVIPRFHGLPATGSKVPEMTISKSCWFRRSTKAV